MQMIDYFLAKQNLYFLPPCLKNIPAPLLFSACSLPSLPVPAAFPVDLFPA